MKIAELEAEAVKAQQVKQAEGQARVRVLQAKGEADAMQYMLPLKEKQIQQSRLEAEARKEATIKNAEAAAQAKVIDSKAELEKRGVEVVRFDDREFTLDLSAPDPEMVRCHVVVERCVNHLRALYTLRVLNDWGVPTVNSYDVANICGDKLLTSAALEREGVPAPRTIISSAITC